VPAAGAPAFNAIFLASALEKNGSELAALALFAAKSPQSPSRPHNSHTQASCSHTYPPAIQGITPPQRALDELMVDVDALLRRCSANSALLEDTCRCLASLVLSCESIAESVFAFCESVYGSMRHLVPHAIEVRLCCTCPRCCRMLFSPDIVGAGMLLDTRRCHGCLVCTLSSPRPLGWLICLLGRHTIKNWNGQIAFDHSKRCHVNVHCFRALNPVVSHG
jgi:hypothetical protein